MLKKQISNKLSFFRSKARFKKAFGKIENQIAADVASGLDVYNLDSKQFEMPKCWDRTDYVEEYYSVIITDTNGLPRNKLLQLTKKQYAKFLQVKESKRALDWRWSKGKYCA